VDGWIEAGTKRGDLVMSANNLPTDMLHRVKIEEYPSHWVLRGEDKNGVTLPAKLLSFNKQDEQHHLEPVVEQARQWCQQGNLTTYLLERMTGVAMVFLIQTIDGVSGEVLEQREVDYTVHLQQKGSER
jgi:hypothetical protein